MQINRNIDTTSDLQNYINKLNILILDNLKSICSSKSFDKLDNQDLATIFEYYTAIKLIQKTNKNFTLYSKLTPLQKEELIKKGLPTRDIGSDGIDIETYSELFQSKLYGKNKYISVTDIANFFTHKYYSTAPENIKLYLYRTEESKINIESQKLIKNKHIIDETINREEFITYLENLINNYDSNNKKIKTNIKILRDYQEKAIDILHNNKKCILNVPTGCGKTLITLEYISDVFRINRKNNINTTKFLILVPTIVLLEQWYEESLTYGFNIFLFGTGYNNDLTVKILKENNVFICVYNSIENFKPYLKYFEKIIVDEAHRIYKPTIYEEEIEEDVDEIDSLEDIEIEDDTSNLDYDDECDEEVGVKLLIKKQDNKTDIIKSSYNKIINQIINNQKQNAALLSATIDNYDEFTYYSYGIREAINNSYLSDYQIVCPIFNDDPTDKNIAEYIINKKNELHCIVFASNRKIGLNFYNLLNNIKPNCAQFIDCYTSKNDRKNIINSFNNGEIQFLVNVRILTEGFNSPICSSVMFLHLPSNDTFILQAIGRSLRLHESKIVSNIYFPFNTEKDIKDISNFMHTISRNDEKIGLNYKTKNIGTYINIEIENNLTNNEEINVEYKYDLILNNFILKYTPEEKAKMLIEYVFVNKSPPKKNTNIIGSYWSNIKGLKKQHKHIYKTILSKNEILKNDYIESNKKRENKVLYTTEERTKLLIKYIKVYRKAPPSNLKLIGKFWRYIKIRGNHAKLYKDVLSKYKILRDDYEKTKERRKNLISYTPEQRAELLLKYVKSNNKAPPVNCKHIGSFWRNIKGPSQSNNKIYINILSANEILKKDYENALKKKN